MTSRTNRQMATSGRLAELRQLEADRITLENPAPEPRTRDDVLAEHAARLRMARELRRPRA